MNTVIAVLLLIFSASAIAVENCTWVVIDCINTCTHQAQQQRRISGTYTIPPLDKSITATRINIKVSGWQKATRDWSVPVAYSMPITGRYSIMAVRYPEYRIVGNYDVSDGRASPDSPAVIAW